MTASELRREVVKQAESWLGRNEADMSHREIIDIYNSIVPLPRGYRVSYNDYWCATFVSAVAQVCGLTKWIYPECSCQLMIDLYKAAGRWMEDDAYRPREGDIIMYDWDDSGNGDNTGWADHVGYVTGLTGDTIHIIEGNCSNAVKRTTRQVNGRYIRGYCLPDYEAAAGAESVPEEPTEGTPTEPEPDTYTVKPGDSLWAIAMAHGTTVDELARINGIDKNDFIYPGQILKLKDNTTSDDSIDDVWYTVKEGDSICEIAHNTLGKCWRWYKIAEANGLSIPVILTPGQKIKIPRE